MQVSFVIPLFNCLPLTQAMVASLQASLPAGLTHEIILVDDGSTDGTREWLATLATPFRVVLNDRNLGYAAANNRGAALAQGEWLALLNNDLVLPRGWFEPLLAAHRELGPRAGIVGSVQLSIPSGEVDHAGMRLNLKGKWEHIRQRPNALIRHLQPIRHSPAVTGACVLLESDLWRKLGGFDEAYVNGGEDVDLCFRATRAGRVNAVALLSTVHHHVSASPQRKARDEENSRRLTQRWRAEFATGINRTWCWRYLEAYWLGTGDRPDHAAARDLLAYILRLRGHPPRQAVHALNAALDAEFARWDAMFPAAKN